MTTKRGWDRVRIGRDLGGGRRGSWGGLGVELVGGDAVENLGEGELNAGAVLDGGQLEFGLGGVDSAVAAGGVVVVTEGLATQGGGAATVARGVDVTAEEALDGGFGGLGGCG
jgi:hypothetical protein